MADIISIALPSEGLRFGPVQFVRAEWWRQAPQFILLRYTVDETESPTGLRLDLDKGAILDAFEDRSIDAQIKKNSVKIWEAVVQAEPHVARPQRSATWAPA
jgi:hypothetical protein